MFNSWLVSTTQESWELSKDHHVHAFSRLANREKIKPGDKIILYLVRSNPPVIVSIDEITGPWQEVKEPFWPEEKAAGMVMWPWHFPCRTVRQGVVDVRTLTEHLHFIKNKQNWAIHFQGSPANHQTPIPELDYQLIFDELGKPSIEYSIRPLKPRQTPQTPRRTPKLPAAKGPPDHDDLRDIIRDIGQIKKLVAETEYPINDILLDVAWRTDLEKVPSRAWEVHLRGNFYEAIHKLSHAWAYWRARPVLVTNEMGEIQAKKLLQAGTQPEFADQIRIIRWEHIVRLYRLLRETSELEKRLAL